MINQVLLSETACERLREVNDYLSGLPKDDERTTEAQYSFRNSFLHLLTTKQDHDGPILIQSDSAPLSFFWQHGKSGYHGGLIFHRTYDSARNGPTEFGTWSIHT